MVSLALPEGVNKGLLDGPVLMGPRGRAGVLPGGEFTLTRLEFAGWSPAAIDGQYVNRLDSDTLF